MEPTQAPDDGERSEADERSAVTVTRDGARRKRAIRFTRTLNAKISDDHRAQLDAMRAELGVTTDSALVRALIDDGFETMLRRTSRRSGMSEESAAAYREAFEALRSDVDALTRQVQSLGQNVWQALRMARRPGYDVDMVFDRELASMNADIEVIEAAVKALESRLGKLAI